MRGGLKIESENAIHHPAWGRHQRIPINENLLFPEKQGRGKIK